MMCLGEQVKGVDALQGVAGLAQVFEVVGEGGRVAGSIDDFLWFKVDEGLACAGVETRPG